MERRGLDALIATAPPNVNYSSDIKHLNLTRSRIFVVLPKDDLKDSALLMPLGDIRDVVGTHHTWIKDLRPSGKFYIYKEENASLDGQAGAIWDTVEAPRTDDISNLIETLRDKGLTKKRIGLDESGLIKDAFEAIEGRIKNELTATVEGAFSAFREIRMVKTEEEVKRLRHCAQVTEEAIGVALESAREGSSGDEITAAFMRQAWENGVTPRSEGIGLGELSFLNNRQIPPPQILKKGDLIRFDVSCTYESYYSDIARIGVLGEPNSQQKDYYEAVKAGADAAIELIRPGVKASELFRAAVEGTRKAGLPTFDRSHCGHGIGLEMYDEPVIYPHNEAVLEKNMVINIENPFYSIGFGAAQVEDTILVTDDGFEMLSTSDRELRIIR